MCVACVFRTSLTKFLFDFYEEYLFFVKKLRTNDVRLNHTSNKMAEFYFTL